MPSSQPLSFHELLRLYECKKSLDERGCLRNLYITEDTYHEIFPK